jgi:hypothetical protein
VEPRRQSALLVRDEWAGLVIITLSSVLISLASTPVLTVPVGSEGRPMGFAMVLLPVGTATVLVGLMIAVRSFSAGRPLQGALLLLLGFAPFVIGYSALQYAIKVRGYHMLP